MATDLSRPEDLRYDPAEMAAMAYLASYRMPTRGLYEINLRQWFAWCSERGVQPMTVSRAHIEVFARELEEVRGLKLSTIANKLNTIGGFYKHAFIERLIDTNPAEYLKRPKVPRESTRLAPSRVELHKMLDAAEKSGRTSDLLLIGLLGLIGLRVGEACAIDLEDISRNGSYLAVKVRREKGNRAGMVPLPHRLIWPVEAILRHDSTGPLLRTRNGERMDRKAAGRVVTRIRKEVGITKNLTPHSLRHGFVTMALDAGAHARDVQHSMGYADLRMVSYYDRGGDDLARSAVHTVSAHVEGAI